MPVFGAKGGDPGPQQNLHERKLTKAQSRGCGKPHHFLRVLGCAIISPGRKLALLQTFW